MLPHSRVPIKSSTQDRNAEAERRTRRNASVKVNRGVLLFARLLCLRKLRIRATIIVARLRGPSTPLPSPLPSPVGRGRVEGGRGRRGRGAREGGVMGQETRVQGGSGGGEGGRDAREISVILTFLRGRMDRYRANRFVCRQRYSFVRVGGWGGGRSKCY